MTNAGRLVALVMICAAAATACEPGGATTDGEPRAEYEAVARQFGEHVLKGDWAAAFAMTTSQFRGAMPQARLKEAYEDLLRQIRQDDPTFEPNRVETSFGTLPVDEAEARQTYGIVLVPPKASWRAWLSSGIGFGGVQGIERGIDAWLLIVDDLGQLKIAHVGFEFMD
jgi:hypothetical protein